jgi:hypothetical protein
MMWENLKKVFQPSLFLVRKYWGYMQDSNLRILNAVCRVCGYSIRLQCATIEDCWDNQRHIGLLEGY